MSKIERLLIKFCPKTVVRLQNKAINEYSRMDAQGLLYDAIHGISFYVRGDTNKAGWHNLYKFTPENMGKSKTAIIGSNTPTKPVYWKNGSKIEPNLNKESED